MSRNYILRTKIFRPLQPSEAYTRQSIGSAFPGGEWVEEPPVDDRVEIPAEDLTERMKALEPPSNALTVIGELKDLDFALELIEDRAPDKVIVGRLPSGRGAESKIATALEELGVEVEYVDSDPPSVNVEVVLCHDITSPVLLLGKGTRVKEAKSWLGRANWKRELISL